MSSVVIVNDSNGDDVCDFLLVISSNFLKIACKMVSSILCNLGNRASFICADSPLGLVFSYSISY